MADRTKWGKKHVCFRCRAKFYDLNKAVAVCPKCGTDQGESRKKEDEILFEELVDEEPDPVTVDDDDDEELSEEDLGELADEDLPPMEEERGYDEKEEEE